MFHIGDQASFVRPGKNGEEEKVLVEVNGFKVLPDDSMEYRVQELTSGERWIVSESGISKVSA